MEPKAKWHKLSAHCWRAEVGPFRLEVILDDGECQIADAKTYAQLWFQKVATPCDVTDLMRHTESELARRLEKAASTMDGGELVPRTLAAVAKEFMSLGDGQSTQDDVFGDTHSPTGWSYVETSTEPRFKVGDRVQDTTGELGSGRVYSTNARTNTYGVEFDSGNSGPLSGQFLVHEPPRFKVGDLVRTKFSVSVGVVAEIVSDRVSTFVSKDYASRICNSSLTPYVLPTITSYADLASVLDELPEGTVVEVSWKGCSPGQFRRDVTTAGEWFTRLGSGKWVHSSKLQWRSKAVSEGAVWRILPPSEVEP